MGANMATRLLRDGDSGDEHSVAVYDLRGYVDYSGEGRRTVQAAIDENVPAPVITLSRLSRFVSRQDEPFSAKVIAALRNQFGGHAIKPEAAGVR